MASQGSSSRGLSAAEVAERRARGESNAFRARVGRTYWHIFRDNVLNLFNVVLFMLLVIVLLFQDYSTVLFAGFSVVTNSILGMVQEVIAKRKLDRLAALSAQDIRVWRDGQLTPVAVHALVKDDLIPIEPGDRLVVDGRVLESDALEMDESQLTGESDAVFKEPGQDVFSGSFCVAGSGLMVATRVGKDSTINQLASIAKLYKNVQTPTQGRISALVEIMVLAMLIFMPMLFLAGWLQGATLLQIVRNEVVFVTSIVPQGLVLTAILSLTLGAISISRHQTLVQRVNAVESMANVSVLCFDKTGTLTRNQLAVTEIITLNGTPTEAVHALLHAYTGSLAHRNRTAAAVAEYAAQHAPSLNGQGPGRKVREIPFNSSRKWGAVVFQNETLVMGAPERVLHSTANATAARRAQELAACGLRVLAFARLPEAPGDRIEQPGEALALIVLSDQVRPDIRDTLDQFRALNVSLKIISGDNLDTVKAIAAQAGIEIRKAYTGSQMEALTEAEFDAAAWGGDLFARIEPNTKRRIVASLKRQGAYVAMVGDGVNDVPALKEAHLAVAMNDGAQIAKDVAEIVLLNNAMSTLPRAFREGTNITQVIYGTTKLFLTKNLYNILLIFFAGFMMLPFPTSPVQMSWITFGTVNIPATLIAFQLIRPAFMKEFRRDVLDYVLSAGVIGAVNLSLLYAAVFFASHRSVYAGRSAVTLFIALYGALIFLNTHEIELFDPRTWRRRWRVLAIGFGLTFVTMLAPFALPGIFEFVPPTPLVWVLIVAVFLLTAATLTLVMRFRHLVNQLWRLIRP
ncbi:MAG: HAD-IC family P-type ATPase [Chloroflexi bacterium]|nr:HAD-IC family P-type ATPase [Chloroflexota bacterium]